ncbi:hypothetical protein AC579_5629 [Pseudocercospora musae]|uniref:Uncharacterized protein n=1 Tax=Pseudocercospora musae TaxID=113226 RepID=A0A139IEL6_9PEZI|nr:hypothetical protein AC579_5629 [Pseudocercospora musae]
MYLDQRSIRREAGAEMLTQVDGGGPKFSRQMPFCGKERKAEPQSHVVKEKAPKSKPQPSMHETKPLAKEYYEAKIAGNTPI